MAYQWRLKNYSVTASQIITQVDFKRDTDVQALPNSLENISYPTGTPLKQIEDDLNNRAKNKIDTYENDETIKQAAEKYMDTWVTVPEPAPVL